MTESLHSVTLRVEADHPSLAGHFPGQPVVPGVLLLDRIVASLQSAEPDAWHVVGLPQIKFLSPLLPEQDARIDWQRAADRLRFRVFRLDAAQQSTLLASGDITLAAR